MPYSVRQEWRVINSGNVLYQPTLEEARAYHDGEGEPLEVFTVINDATGDVNECYSRDIADRLCAFLNATPAPIHVVIALQGGLVQGGIATVPGVNLTVLDYDTDGADETVAIPQGSEADGEVDACVSSWDIKDDPEGVNSVLRAIERS